MMGTTEILADPLLEGRKIISQRSRTTDDLDTFLAEMGMSRKRIPRDESNLYRAVADQLWGNQAQFQRVKTDLHKLILSYSTQIPTDGNFNSSPFVEQLLGEFILIASSVYKKDVCLFIQRGLVIQRFVYNNASPIVSSESVCGRQVLYLSIDNDFYWDSVYTFEEMAALAHNQAFIYDILYSGVFSLQGVTETVTTMLDRNQSFTVQCMRDGRSRETLEKLTQGDLSIYDDEQNLVVLTNLGVTPFPYKVAKCLSPFMYRNVSYDIWDTHRGLRSRGVYLRIGCKCVVHLKENIKCMGFVQELNNAKDTATVFIEDLGQKCEVPQCLLEVVTTSISRTLGHFSRGDKMGRQTKTQRGTEPTTFTKQARLPDDEELKSKRNINRLTFGAPSDKSPTPNKMRCLSPSSSEHSEFGCGRFALDEDLFKSSSSSEDGDDGHGFIDTENPYFETTSSAPYENSVNAETAPAYLSYEHEQGPNCPSHIAEQERGVPVLNSEQGAANLLGTQSSQRTEEYTSSAPSSVIQQFVAGGQAGDQQGVPVPRPDLLNFIVHHNSQPNFAGYLFEGPNNEGPMQPNMVKPTSYPNTPYYMPVDQNASFSFEENGSDLPFHDVNTLRYFYNHGIQFVLACQLQDYTKRPVFTSPPALVLCNNIAQARVVGPIGVVNRDGVIMLEEYPPTQFLPLVGHVLTTANMPQPNAETATATATAAASSTVQTMGAPENVTAFNPVVGALQVMAHDQPEGNAPAPPLHSFFVDNPRPQDSLPNYPWEYSVPPPFNPTQQSVTQHQEDGTASADLYLGAPLVSPFFSNSMQPHGSLPQIPTNYSIPPPPPLNPVGPATVTHHQEEGTSSADLYIGAPLVSPFFSNSMQPQGSLPQIPTNYSIPPPPSLNPVGPATVTHHQEDGTSSADLYIGASVVSPFFSNSMQPQGSLPQIPTNYTTPPPLNPAGPATVTHLHQTEGNATAAELYTEAPIVRPFFNNNMQPQVSLPQSPSEYFTPPPIFNHVRPATAQSDTQQSPTLQPTEYNLTIRAQPLITASSPLVSPPVVSNAQNVLMFPPWSRENRI